MTDEKTVATVSTILEKNRDQLRLSLPTHIDPARFANAALLLLRQQPALATCTPQSFFGALVLSAQLGLVPGPLAHAYFVPFWNNKVTPSRREVQFIPSYKGLVHLAQRSPDVDVIRAFAVYEHDSFHYTLGLNPDIQHTPVLENRGALIAFYAYVKLANGEPLIHVMSKTEIDQHRDKYSKAAKDGPWVSEYVQMALKTVLRKALKLAPLSTELETGIALDELAGSRLSQTPESNVPAWIGMDEAGWEADTPTQEEEVEAETGPPINLPNMGKYANQPIPCASTKALGSYINTLQKNIKDPHSSKWLTKNQAMLTAIQEEIAKRADVEAVLPKDKEAYDRLFNNYNLKALDDLDWTDEVKIAQFVESCKEEQAEEVKVPS